jgi:hypothetical protein
MLDRRQSVRDKVLYGGVATETSWKSDCVVRNISESGACVEFNSTAKLPEEMNLKIEKRGRSFLGRMIWQQAGRVGLAFRIMAGTALPASDLDERLRRSEQKKRALQRRIKELIGEG